MSHKTGNYTDYRLIAVVQSKTCDKCIFAGSLTLNIFSRIISSYLLVLFRIKNIIIDAVQNTFQLVLLCNKNPVKSVSEPGVKNLPRIAGTYGCNHIRSFNSTFHHVDIAVVFQQICMVKRYSHKLVENLSAVASLIFNVVYSKDVLYLVISLLILIVNVVVNRNQGSLPVICIDYVRLEVNMAEHFKNGTGKENKSLAVVIKSVKTVPCKVILIIDKIVDNAIFLSRENTAVLLTP